MGKCFVIHKWRAEELRRLYWDEQKNSREIAKLLEVCQGTIIYTMRKFNIPRRTKPEIKGSLHGNWKGGRTISKRGYVLVLDRTHPRADSTTGYVSEHILVWEQAHDKPLPEGWVIHHLNGIKSDNRSINLIAFPDRKHKNILQAKAKRIQELEGLLSNQKQLL